jgi:hypothetical protein
MVAILEDTMMDRPSEKLIREREAKLDALGPCPPWWHPFARRRWRRRRDAILAMDCSQMTEMLREWYSDEMLRDLAARPAIDFGNIAKRPRSP